MARINIQKRNCALACCRPVSQSAFHTSTCKKMKPYVLHVLKRPIVTDEIFYCQLVQMQLNHHMNNLKSKCVLKTEILKFEKSCVRKVSKCSKTSCMSLTWLYTVDVILYLDIVTPILLGVIYCPRPMRMGSIKPVGRFFDKLLIRNAFPTYCASDHDLGPKDPNFNRGHLLFNADAHEKNQVNR
ncbi:hypothetical protein DPMN_096209 [Dreissena polymorpha]|uniref:Uncharacterized protein n=1 Tax=Dreissena polymorpha TaxID=45954 RepID=A0A9D4LAQ1_DREPO|nr:hypothetical protein DPMN_096209 [Dreissena polymorpha]